MDRPKRRVYNTNDKEFIRPKTQNIIEVYLPHVRVASTRLKGHRSSGFMRSNDFIYWVVVKYGGAKERNFKKAYRDLYDWRHPECKCKMTLGVIKNFSMRPKGELVNCNEKSVALFKHDDQIYAIDEKCPHAGGPLHLGDIEEMPSGEICVRCPWHSWRFNLQDGTVYWPMTRKDKKTIVYPTKVDSNGTIYVGFDKIDEKYFQPELFDF